jgi:tripartite-type tricarboxylate transporter receptor subunit TctC
MPQATHSTSGKVCVIAISRDARCRGLGVEHGNGYFEKQPRPAHTHVPYRGTGPAMQDLQGSRIDYLCEIVSTAKPQIDGGTVKGIAMMTKERSMVLPDVPTGIEQGVPNLEAYTWNAIFLPKGAPAEMVNTLNRATAEAMESPNVSERLEGLGAVIVPPVSATPEYLAHFVRSEIEKWTGPIKASGVTVE